MDSPETSARTSRALNLMPAGLPGCRDFNINNPVRQNVKTVFVSEEAPSPRAASL